MRFGTADSSIVTALSVTCLHCEKDGLVTTKRNDKLFDSILMKCISFSAGSFTIRLTNLLFACVLLSSVMTCAWAAPSPKVLHFPPQSHVPHSSYDENPCGVDNIVSTPLRHSGAANAMKVLKHLERHLSETLRDFNHLNKSKISIQYKDSMNMTKHFVNKFLPKNQLAEFKKFRANHATLSQKEMVSIN